MGAGCSSSRGAQAPDKKPLPNSGSGKKDALNGAVGMTSSKKDLAANFVIETFEDPDDPANQQPAVEYPKFPAGSREATLIKCFKLLDKNGSGFLEVNEWKLYMLQAGVSKDALERKVSELVQHMDHDKDSKISGVEFVASMMALVGDWDDKRFAKLLQATLTNIRGAGGASIKREHIGSLFSSDAQGRSALQSLPEAENSAVEREPIQEVSEAVGIGKGASFAQEQPSPGESATTDMLGQGGPAVLDAEDSFGNLPGPPQPTKQASDDGTYGTGPPIAESGRRTSSVTAGVATMVPSASFARASVNGEGGKPPGLQPSLSYTRQQVLPEPAPGEELSEMELGVGGAADGEDGPQRVRL